MAAFMPWPVAGEKACAASPARNSRPRRNRLASRRCTATREDHRRSVIRASRPARSIRACRSMAETGGPNDPGSSRPGVAGRVARRRQVARSPRRKANSSPLRPATTWAASPGRSPSSSASASTTSTGYTRPVQRRPAWARTVLAGPSQPTAKPNRASSDPAGVRRTARTPPGSSRTAASSVPRSTSTPRSASASRQHPLHVHLPDQRQVREGGVRQREIAEPDADHAGAEPQVGRWRGVGPGQQRRRHPERAQHLQRAGVQDERA